MRGLLCLILLAVPALAHGPEALPTWAVSAARAGLEAKAPEGADAWVLLQRTEFTYFGEGRYQKRQYRLVRVITARGQEEAAFRLSSNGGKSGNIKKLMGWNLRPDGGMVKLDSEDVLSGVGDVEASFSTSVRTQAQLTGVIPGSVVAFESIQEVRLPPGPADLLSLLEEHPIRRWEVTADLSQGWFKSASSAKVRLETRHFSPWVGQANLSDISVVVTDLPPLPIHEPMHPHAINALPFVSVAFVEPEGAQTPSLASWNDYARWVQRSYQPKFQPISPLKEDGKVDGKSLASILSWMSVELLYKQVYLTPERGWIPESSVEVLRRRYGDCKDLTACFSGAAIAAGYEPHPALTRIGDGSPEADPPINPYLFNHVITAVRLKATMGLPAEVETPRGRFLLVDPTSRMTPLGLLPPVHRFGRAMICLEDGAQWVDIPSKAIQPEAVDITIKGSVDASGTLVGTVLVAEQGDAASLRAATRFGNSDNIKDLLARLLGLDANDELTVASLGRPEVLETPLEISAKVRLPASLRRSGGEYLLRQTGFPGLPPAIPREGPARLFPLESRSNLKWRLRLELDLPKPLRPLGEGREIDTPFRVTSWSVRVENTHLSGEFKQSRRDASFGHDQKEEGLRMARKDRSQLNNLLEDATTFKESP